ncbi:MAG: 30S ribosome-binding factor RbfA [Candidatus Gastranaerophilales bacterium]|nr:30S ribosome-binding factor RbfA [Candidatus Gastranaerophilales bacterium]
MNNRQERIRKTMMKEVGDIILKEVRDRRIKGLISVTDIELATDYSIAKIYVSVYGTPEEQEQSLEALKEHASQVRYEIGKRVRLRLTPKIEFLKDISLERGSRVSALIDKISKGEL